MDADERFNILSATFDPESLVDDCENVPFDPSRDRFYLSLLSSVSDEKLRNTVLDLRDSRLAVGRLSHAPFLLPWSVQPSSEFAESASSGVCAAQPKIGTQLKASLQEFVSRAKGEAESVKRMLELRLTGYTSTRNACYKFLREACNSNREVVICLRPSGSVSAVRCRGSVVFFDRSSNMLLSNVKVDGDVCHPFMYIR
ncbi:dynein heavy chain axonemal, putative [Babesia ovata]|uniref:Dynein heavy chain axonemal, putative n=1 Tax=Babesia ovata TaxID=189622 RepID=A0A2H6K6A3_9APIC|nr:dynein heavy chain axonemal, putative [Babesia ovata]GBE58524.1 dynein heavy chain axonemal, putative [Babesia ovata]